jgi:hypothetical protein
MASALIHPTCVATGLAVTAGNYTSRSKIWKELCQCLVCGFLRSGSMILKARASRHAQSTRDGGKLGQGLLAVIEIERGPRGEMIQDRLQLDGFIEFFE